MLDLRRLRLLREVHLRGSIVAAADANRLTSPAVSQHLAALEREVGVPLLRRQGRGVVLTTAGVLLAERTAVALEVLELAERDAKASVDDATGRIRMVTFQSATLALMPPLLHLLRERHPLLRVELLQHEPESALWHTFAGDFDLVVAEEYPHHAAPHHPGLDRVMLGHDPLRFAVPLDAAPASEAGTLSGSSAVPEGTASDDVLLDVAEAAQLSEAAPSPLAFSSIASLADAANFPWVMEPRGAASRHFADQQCRLAGFEPDVRYETADLQAQIRLIEDGHAVGILNDLTLQARPARVRFIDLPDTPERSIFTAARSAAANGPEIAAVREALAEVAATLLP